MLADIIPAKARKVVYTVLGTLVAVEAIVDVVPASVEAKTLAVLVVCGFTVAAGNTPKA